MKSRKIWDRRILGTLAALALLVDTTLLSLGVIISLPGRSILLTLVLASGAAALVGIGLVAMRLGSERAARILLVLILALLVLPPASAVWPGGITHASFGFTVVGICPLPVFDLTFHANGGVWFRTKTHLVTVEELRALLDQDVEEIIVATGWQGAVEIEPGFRGARVTALPNAEALERYREQRRLGKRVALILHATC